jgi:hypothetical protein
MPEPATSELTHVRSLVDKAEACYRGFEAQVALMKSTDHAFNQQSAEVESAGKSSAIFRAQLESAQKQQAVAEENLRAISCSVKIFAGKVAAADENVYTAQIRIAALRSGTVDSSNFQGAVFRAFDLWCCVLSEMKSKVANLRDIELRTVESARFMRSFQQRAFEELQGKVREIESQIGGVNKDLLVVEDRLKTLYQEKYHIRHTRESDDLGESILAEKARRSDIQKIKRAIEDDLYEARRLRDMAQMDLRSADQKLGRAIISRANEISMQVDSLNVRCVQKDPRRVLESQSQRKFSDLISGMEVDFRNVIDRTGLAQLQSFLPASRLTRVANSMLSGPGKLVFTDQDVIELAQGEDSVLVWLKEKQTAATTRLKREESREAQAKSNYAEAKRWVRECMGLVSAKDSLLHTAQSSKSSIKTDIQREARRVLEQMAELEVSLRDAQAAATRRVEVLIPEVYLEKVEKAPPASRAVTEMGHARFCRDRSAAAVRGQLQELVITGQINRDGKLRVLGLLDFNEVEKDEQACIALFGSLLEVSDEVTAFRASVQERRRAQDLGLRALQYLETVDEVTNAIRREPSAHGRLALGLTPKLDAAILSLKEWSRVNHLVAETDKNRTWLETVLCY